MCRNIKRLHPFDPPATKDEVRASALQYVRKLTGMNTPSQANQEAFDEAVEEITSLTLRLFEKLEVHGHLHTREEEREKAAERGKKREAQLRQRYAR